MPLAPPPWLSPALQDHLMALAAPAEGAPAEISRLLDARIAENRAIHDRRGLNLNPASNVMNPAAEALLSAGLGPRASLGPAGAKYETGLGAIEAVEALAAGLAARVFRAPYAEIRAGSGAMANLMAFMAVCAPGDAVIVPPAEIGGHVTHHAEGAAGLYGLRIHPAPVDAEGYTVALPALAALAERVRPRLITLGGSLNLLPHPVAAVVEIARAVGAKVLFDAAHLSGPIAGGAWPDPLAEGADLMTMSTYKSLGGSPGGLILTADAGLAERLDRIAFPGLTANADPGRAAALARTLLDWVAHGPAYAAAMAETARALAAALALEGVEVFCAGEVATRSHAFALEAAPLGGGHAAARRMAESGLLACGIGLPLPEVPGDLNGLRLGTPEISRLGFTVAEMPELAALIAAALRGEQVAPAVADLRARVTAGGLAYVLP